MFYQVFIALLGSAAAAALGALLDAGRLGRFSDTVARILGRPEHPPVESIEGRITRLAELMTESSTLVTGISAELEARAQTLAQLQAEAENAQQIIQLTNEQKEAVAKLVRSEVAGEGRRSFRLSIWVGLLYALAGALVTLAVTLFVHPAYLPK